MPIINLEMRKAETDPPNCTLDESTCKQQAKKKKGISERIKYSQRKEKNLHQFLPILDSTTSSQAEP
ncbi:hypothetical protein EUGRSUZ_E02799 [Eucalyptus grandis]|uniref:Uncharacterized protein n=2 Tax=Eucalyptus grandis TaxID=71139 RepID=A0ACC3KYL1_EUCGR|nr:hypothetical protein EUGRSUZ_E02799 [Eucalyptus grandis]